MVEPKHLELLQFDRIIELVQLKCHSHHARIICAGISPKSNSSEIILGLNQTQELKSVLAGDGYFPSVEHEDIQKDLSLLSLEGSALHENQLVKVMKTI